MMKRIKYAEEGRSIQLIQENTNKDIPHEMKVPANVPQIIPNFIPIKEKSIDERFLNLSLNLNSDIVRH